MEENPIETFLFETRYGLLQPLRCRFVYLMRVANIPARVVTGYQGGELNKVGNFWKYGKLMPMPGQKSGWRIKLGSIRPHGGHCTGRIERNINIDQLVPGGAISYMPTGAAAQAALTG